MPLPVGFLLKPVTSVQGRVRFRVVFWAEQVPDIMSCSLWSLGRHCTLAISPSGGRGGVRAPRILVLF